MWLECRFDHWYGTHNGVPAVHWVIKKWNERQGEDVFEDGEDLSGKEFDLIACDGETEWRYNNIPFSPRKGDFISVGEYDSRLIKKVNIDYHTGIVLIHISRSKDSE